VFETLRKKAEGTPLASIITKSEERLRLSTMGPSRPHARR
jgi:hypothetical protein